MTTVIDWNKAPHDATHAGTSIYNGSYVCWYKDISSNSYRYFYSNPAENEWRHGNESPHHQPLIPRPTRPEIDLKTLNVTFGELDRETKLRLAEHVIDGGDVSRYVNGEWVNYGDLLHFCFCTRYRAAWTERDKVEADIITKESELDELYVKVNNLQDKE